MEETAFLSATLESNTETESDTTEGTFSPLNSQKGEKRNGEGWRHLQQNKIGARARKMQAFRSRTTEEKTMMESKSFIAPSSQ